MGSATVSVIKEHGDMPRRPVLIIVMALLVVGLTAAIAEAWLPHGFRNATHHEKRGLNHAVKHAPKRFLRLKHRYAWLVIRKDDRYAIVCGHHPGVHGKGGVAVDRAGHPWRVETSSGSIQYSDLKCREYAHHN